MRERSVTGTCAFLLLAVVACADGGPDAAGGDDGAVRQGGTVVIAAPSDLENLNSLVTGDQFTQEVARDLLFLPLVDYAPDLSYEPVLAERWDLLADTGVVFHLRRDVRWHDGTPTTAHDVVFTFSRAKDPETAFPNADYFAAWTRAEVRDSFTVAFSFEPHVEPLAGLPFMPIMPLHQLDTVPSARMRQAAFNKRPVGNGPFRFVEYRAGDRWVFEANPDHPEALGGRPNVDRIVWRVIPEPSAQLVELRTGTADLILTAQPEEFERISQEPGIRGLQRPARQFGNVMWNGRVRPLNDPNVRRALTLAMDREQMVQVARAGFGHVASGPIGPFHWAFDREMAPLPFDPDSARALLDAAGIRDTDGDGVRERRDGRPFAIELKIPAGAAASRDIAEMVRGDLARIGVRVTPRAVDFATMIQDFTSPDRNFEAIVLAWSSDFRISLRDLFHTDAMDGQFQIASYSNPRVDSLIDVASVTHDRADARRVFSELQHVLRDEQPWSFLYYYEDLILMRERLRNVEMDIRGPFINVGEWWLADARPATAQERSDSAGRSPDRAPEPGQ